MKGLIVRKGEPGHYKQRIMIIVMMVKMYGTKSAWYQAKHLTGFIEFISYNNPLGLDTIPHFTYKETEAW